MYERLTQRTEKGTAVFNNVDIGDIAKKLCEIEDKICEGKMVELPCAVGDTVYCIRYDRSRKPYIKPLRVLSITTYGEDVVTLFTTRDDRLGLTVFLTPEEANKKLKELENED